MQCNTVQYYCMHLKQNLGKSDRVARLVIGIVLLPVSVITGSGLLFLGALFCFYEALASWCIVYQVLGKNTCPLPSNKRTTIPFLRPLWIGFCILLGAIVLNYTIGFIGWKSWYQVIATDKSAISIDNYVFLLLIYPLILGGIAIIASTITNKLSHLYSLYSRRDSNPQPNR